MTPPPFVTLPRSFPDSSVDTGIADVWGFGLLLLGVVWVILLLGAFLHGLRWLHGELRAFWRREPIEDARKILEPIKGMVIPFPNFRRQPPDDAEVEKRAARR